jgi:hypothetical protein
MKILSILLLFYIFTALKYISIDTAVTHVNRNMYEPDEDYIFLIETCSSLTTPTTWLKGKTA